MSVQYGQFNFDGKPVERNDLDRVRSLLAPYGPDGEGCICQNNLAILYRAFHATSESRNEVQPHRLSNGVVITWDGRLDNREELAEGLTGKLRSTDVEIAAAAYDRWGVGAFGRLIGDWAVSIWNPRDQELLLARDFIGTRHLYYAVDGKHVQWCTILDPLVLLNDRSPALEEEYLAGWLAFFPAPHLTPYVGIRAVPPSSVVRFTQRNQTISKYWDFDPSKETHYSTDAEYEEHFRGVFAQSVRRRLRSDRPVLAELSGGVDSSSIVCVADEVLTGGLADTPRLDTLSYYDDSEPNWNERPFFSKLEEKRGRPGHHIDVTPNGCADSDFIANQFIPTPAHWDNSPDLTRQTAECIRAGGYRVLLSGTGGDEFAGGVPSPIPEIADLLVTGQVRVLARQLKLWALAKRQPWLHLFFEAAKEFLPSAIIPLPGHPRPAPWLRVAFVTRQRLALAGYRSRIQVFGNLPSFQESVATVEGVRRQLASHPLPDPHFEERYPFLDRDLLVFLFSIPREQLLRPGQRRSLMRRALRGIVPEDILNRKRKAYVTRAASLWILKQAAAVGDVEQFMLCGGLNLIDGERFSDALNYVREGKEVPVVPIMRALTLESWLRSLACHKVMAHSPVAFTKSQSRMLERASTDIASSAS